MVTQFYRAVIDHVYLYFMNLRNLLYVIETQAAVRMLFDTLKEQRVDTVHILLDEPVSNSGCLKALIADVGEGYPFKLDIGILKEVDKTLWEKENVITADAIILDHCISWINLIKNCAKKHNAKTIKVWK